MLILQKNISYNIEYLGSSGSEVYELVSSALNVVTSASFGANYTEPAVQSIAANLYNITVIKSCQKLSVYKDLVLAATITIQTSIVYLIKEINNIKTQILLFTGEEFNLSTLNISVINESTGEIFETSVSSITYEETEVNSKNLNFTATIYIKSVLKTSLVPLVTTFGYFYEFQ